MIVPIKTRSLGEWVEDDCVWARVEGVCATVKEATSKITEMHNGFIAIHLERNNVRVDAAARINAPFGPHQVSYETRSSRSRPTNCVMWRSQREQQVSNVQIAAMR